MFATFQDDIIMILNEKPQTVDEEHMNCCILLMNDGLLQYLELITSSPVQASKRFYYVAVLSLLNTNC